MTGFLVCQKHQEEAFTSECPACLKLQNQEYRKVVEAALSHPGGFSGICSRLHQALLAFRNVTKPLTGPWDESPKGCWIRHPISREICQLPLDGHQIHIRKHPNGVELECWGHTKDIKGK